LSWRLLGVLMLSTAHGALPVHAQEATSSAPSEMDRPVQVSPGIGDRPIIEEPSGLRYLGPTPASPGVEYRPFVKPKYYEAPLPATGKYRDPGAENATPTPRSAPPGGRLKPLN